MRPQHLLIVVVTMSGLFDWIADKVARAIPAPDPIVAGHVAGVILAVLAVGAILIAVFGVWVIWRLFLRQPVRRMVKRLKALRAMKPIRRAQTT